MVWHFSETMEQKLVYIEWCKIDVECDIWKGMKKCQPFHLLINMEKLFCLISYEV